jgi:hypothetical protein
MDTATPAFLLDALGAAVGLGCLLGAFIAAFNSWRV